MILDYHSGTALKPLFDNAVTQHIPVYGAFELTARCNLNCKMCFVHNLDVKKAKESELSTDQWKHIFDDAIDSGMLFALFTGGECMLREDFDELYLYLYNRGVIMSVNTNATMINEERAIFFSKYRPERIQISVYGSSDDAYERVTEKRLFSKLENALDLLKKYNLIPDLVITPSKYLLEDYENILKMISSRGLTYTTSAGLIPPRDGHSIEDCYLSIDEYISIKKIEHRLAGKSIKKRQNPAPIPGCDCKEIVYGIPCNAGTIRAVITADGKMIPCMSIHEISCDVLENGFIDSWKYIYQTMEKVKQPPICSNCAYKKKCIRCPSIRYDGLFSGECNKSVCDLMVAKYNAGL